MGIPVKLEVFEGPLDLLLHLIDKNKIDIYDIPIVEITNQYMEYIRQMQQDNLNIMSEFLVMAATLLDIKCKMLLPKSEEEKDEEEDPRQELVEQLLQYKMYRHMAYQLKEREQEFEEILYKEPSLPEEVKGYTHPVDLDVLLDGISLARLQQVFQEVVRRSVDKVDPVRSRFGRIEREEVNLSEKLLWLEEHVRQHTRCSFQGVLEGQSGKMQIVVTFLALLELMRAGKIRVLQEDTCGEIWMESLM
jgi:segregation and condensation protein A